MSSTNLRESLSSSVSIRSLLSIKARCFGDLAVGYYDTSGTFYITGMADCESAGPSTIELDFLGD